MRTRMTASIASLIMISTCTMCCAQELGKPIDIFNGSLPEKTHIGWRAIGEGGESKAADIWEVHQDVLVMKAGPNGYLRTEKNFKDFVLKLQWRRPADKKPGRGGVLIRMTGDDKIWPKSLEAQLNAGDAGDFWGLDGFALKGPGDRFKQLEHDNFGTLTNVKKEQDAEKTAGEWNDYEIIAKGRTVTLKINGKVVNRATNCDDVEGKICLTAEGDEIHFRNVQLIPILE
jgi:hypothetical protein